LDIRIGDPVCILVNGDVPFVMRPAEEQLVLKWLPTWRKKEYHLVGECYIHMLMDGEAWDDKSRVEDLVLV
jgi:bifunctional DNA-binding transcriptional regulator/antitoxin component of YhaV-PrlF toxin-antitoxin module